MFKLILENRLVILKARDSDMVEFASFKYKQRQVFTDSLGQEKLALILSQ